MVLCRYVGNMIEYYSKTMEKDDVVSIFQLNLLVKNKNKVCLLEKIWLPLRLNNYQYDDEDYTKYLNADGGDGVPAGLGR